MRKVMVLGGGVTGLTFAMEMSRSAHDAVHLVESSAEAGGLAASFTVDGRVIDLGSHRVHSGYQPEALALVRELLGDDLLERPRRGQIRIQGRFLRYPPSAFEVLTSFGTCAGLEMARDYALALRSAVRGVPSRGSYEQYAIRAVGKSLYERFYKPYALKLWGVDPRSLSFEAAMGRVQKFSAEVLTRQLQASLSRGSRASDVFFYPKHGFGQIAKRLEARLRERSGRIDLETEVVSVELGRNRRIRAVRVRGPDGQIVEHTPDVVVSTLPIDVIQRLVSIGAGGSPVASDASSSLTWRSLRMLCVLTDDKIPSEHETYYFPEPDVLFGRVSEPAKYSPFIAVGDGRTALTIEVPCSFGDGIWSMPDDAFADRCIRDLRKVGILSATARGVTTHFSRRIRRLYPVFERGWQAHLDRALTSLDRVGNLYLVGRPALFLHCNVDHCIVMALQLARLLRDGPEDCGAEWVKARHKFRAFTLHD